MTKKGYVEKKILDKYIINGCFTVEKHPDSDLYIYGYTTGPLAHRNIVWNKTNIMMRGLIINGDGKVISRPFAKFFTFRQYLSEKKILLSDGQIANLPNLDYKIHEKLDGSLSILYWIDDTPYLASQRSFTSLKAKKANDILHSKYSHLFDKLKKDRTYIFEALYPESNVIVNYDNVEDLILLGVIHNETGLSLDITNTGFPSARDWTEDLKNIESFEDLMSLNLRNKEGFVITYNNGFKLKIKFPWYKEAHDIVNKIISHDYFKSLQEKKLKKLLGFPKNTPDTIKIWERFNKGDKPTEILADFPYPYKFIGIEEWLINEYNKFIELKNKASENEIVKPKDIVRFDVDNELYKPSSENIMWKKWIELEKKYD